MTKEQILEKFKSDLADSETNKENQLYNLIDWAKVEIMMPKLRTELAQANCTADEINNTIQAFSDYAKTLYGDSLEQGY